MNVGFWEAWEKYGDAKLDVIETIEDTDAFALTDMLNTLEAHWIQHYHATNPKCGYNRIPGGGAISASEKVIRKAFKKLFDEAWKERDAFYRALDGKVHQSAKGAVSLSQEEAEFLRELVLPEIPGDYRKYIKLSDEGILSFRKARTDYNAFFEEEAYSWLLMMVKEMADMEMNELGREVAQYISENSAAVLSEGIIQQVAKDGTVVKEYSAIAEVMHELNLSYTTNIYNVLEGKQKTAYGFIWQWKKQ